MQKHLSPTEEMRAPMYSKSRNAGLAAASILALAGLIMTLLFFATL